MKRHVQVFKRLFDAAASAAGLLLLAPVLLAIGLLVRATSPGPALFIQKRVGRHGRPFGCMKFRTMTVRAGAEQGGFDAGQVSRVTPVGRFLRKTKMDELPQLWNVLRGEMSLVGPRPEVGRWVEAYPERWARILAVRPGITDPASIEFRNEEEILRRSADPERTYREEILPRKLALYERYVKEQSWWGDVAILWKTVCAVSKG